MTDVTETTRVPMRSLTPEEAVQTWDQTLPGYNQAEAIEEAKRALAFDLELSTKGCPFHVDARRLAEHVSRGEWDAAARVVHEGHFMPQTMGMHCHRYCETALLPNGGLTIPRPERIRVPDWAPNISALEWAAGQFGARPEFHQGDLTGKRVAVVGGGSGGLMCAWVLRQLGHAVDVYDRDTLPGGLLMSGYPSFRLEKPITRRENDPQDWGVTFFGEHDVTPEELRRFTEEYDAIYLSPGRVPRRNFVGPDGGPLPGEDLEGVVTGTDVLRDTWYGNPPSIGPRVIVFGGGQTAIDVARTARRLGCQVESIYRRGPGEMQVGPAPEISIRMMEEEGIKVRTMADPRRFIGRDGRLVAVELITMAYGEVDASGRPSTHPVEGSAEIVEVDTAIRAIGEVYDVKALVEPLGIEVMAGGYIHIDPVSKRTAHPKVWAGGDVCAGRGNHGAAHDGDWAARAIDAFLNGRYNEWRAEAAASNDADLLHRDAKM